jgi:hypothetical protein
MTPLDKALKRSLAIKGIDYVITLTPDALKLTRKGKRLGIELKWADITSGDSALAIALQASVGRFEPAAGTLNAQKEAGDAPRSSRRVPRASAQRARRAK